MQSVGVRSRIVTRTRSFLSNRNETKSKVSKVKVSSGASDNKEVPPEDRRVSSAQKNTSINDTRDDASHSADSMSKNDGKDQLRDGEDKVESDSQTEDDSQRSSDMFCHALNVEGSDDLLSLTLNYSMIDPGSKLSSEESSTTGSQSTASHSQQAISIKRGSSPNRKKRSNKYNDDSSARSTHSRRKEVQTHATNSKAGAVQIRTLYNDIDAMVDIVGVSTLLTEIHDENHTANDNTKKETPISMLDAWKMICNQQSYLERKQYMWEYDGDGSRHGRRMDTLYALKDRFSMEEKNERYATTSNNESVSIIKMVHSTEISSSLVHTIALDHKDRTVTLCFCPITSKYDFDWSKNMKVCMKKITNPLSQSCNQSSHLHIHHIFATQLFGACQSEITSSNGTPLTEYHCLLQETIIPLLQKYAGYKLCVTGHGAGAALASLFSFVAATESDKIIPKPVSCITFGCPRVGDVNYLKATNYLETEGKLCHVAVVNERDSIAHNLRFSFQINHVLDGTSSIGLTFVNTGNTVTFYKDGEDDGSCIVSWPKNDVYYCEGFLSSLKVNPFDVIDRFTNHNFSSYAKLVQICKPYLSRTIMKK